MQNTPDHDLTDSRHVLPTVFSFPPNSVLFYLKTTLKTGKYPDLSGGGRLSKPPENKFKFTIKHCHQIHFLKWIPGPVADLVGWGIWEHKPIQSAGSQFSLDTLIASLLAPARYQDSL